jgi:hypothetical protein
MHTKFKKNVEGDLTILEAGTGDSPNSGNYDDDDIYVSNP